MTSDLGPLGDTPLLPTSALCASWQQPHSHQQPSCTFSRLCADGEIKAVQVQSLRSHQSLHTVWLQTSHSPSLELSPPACTTRKGLGVLISNLTLTQDSPWRGSGGKGALIPVSPLLVPLGTASLLDSSNLDNEETRRPAQEHLM